MTSDPAADPSETASRHRLAALLTSPPTTSKGYPRSETNDRAWARADEQERRRMLRDCGWL